MPTETMPQISWFLNKDMPEGEILSVAGGQAGVYTARSPERDDDNQDSAAVFNWPHGQTVLAVADGFGGQAGGAQASKLAMQKLGSALKSVKEEDSSQLRGAIMDGFEKANEAVKKLAIGAASTMAVVEIQGNVLRPYHAGDSEILVVGQKGKVKLRTVSHSPVGYALESGLIDEKEAMHHEQRHLVSNMIGSDKLRVDVGSNIELAPRDTVLLGSDGLFDNLHIEEIVDRIRKGSFDDLMKEVAEACTKRMLTPKAHHPSKPDDVTLIAFRMGE